jgi:plasmid stability protein
MAKSTATLTIRKVPLRVVRGLKALAKRRNSSMEQEVRSLLEEYVNERASVLKQIEVTWQNQARRPSPEEVDSWITAGRE